MIPLTSTLPLIEKGTFHHSNSISKEQKLSFLQGLGQNIYYLLIYGNIMKLHCSLLDPISNEVAHDLNILGPSME
jgi:hypothetical protein